MTAAVPFDAQMEMLESPASTAVIRTAGRLDASTASRLERVLTDARTKGSRVILLNLEGLEYISSSGLRVLLSARTQTRQAGGDVFLFALSQPVREVFDMVGFSAVFNIFDTMDQALQAASILAGK